MRYEVPEISIVVEGYEFFLETESLFLRRKGQAVRFTFLEVEKPEILVHPTQRSEVEMFPYKKAVAKFKKLISFI